MSGVKATVKHNYELYTYQDEWDRVKAKLGMTEEELRDEVEACLQMWAWADILSDARGMPLENEDSRTLGDTKA